MTAPDTTPATVAEPGATMTVDLPEAIDDAILAALRAARAFGAASELATAAEAHGLDGGPFWASEVRASEAVDTARFALRQAIADALAAAEHRRLAVAAARDAAVAGLRAVEALMDESYGVAGLHLNSDIAPWGDLRTGGQYEEWLLAFDAALAAAAELAAVPPDGAE